MKARVIGVLAAMTVCVSASLAATASAASPPAPGAPGTESYFDLARKDCVGTARNSTSRVWFTVAGGVLSDTYWPNVDATNVHTLQYLVTDGSTFTDLQTRDMTYKVIPDFTGMSCTVVASPTNPARAHYSITTTYIADPARDSVLMRTRFEAPPGDQLYVRLDPLAGGTGGGGSQNAGANSAVLTGQGVPVAYNTNTTTNASNRDYAVPTYMALQSSDGFASASVGYAGSASDGQTMLDSAARSLTAYGSAPKGHVTLTAGLALPRDRTVDLALGFGTTQSAALSTADASVTQRFDDTWERYERQWVRYDADLRRPSFRLGAAAVREYYESVNVVKASEDKQFPGAIAAGLASPWGQAVPAGNASNNGSGPPNYFGSYREVFARDLYEAFAGLLVAGDISTAQDATRFLFDRQQQPDGSMPRNSLENGKLAPDTGGLQLDETAYPILMAWQSGLARDGHGSLYTDHVIAAADFLVAHGPSDGVERWEEQSGYSPSTIAAEIAGLTAAAHIAKVNHDPLHADIYQATADDFARNIEAWTVTKRGPYGTGTYFLRLSKTGDPNAAINYNLGNGSISDDQRRIVDQGFLELVRLGVLPASDPDVKASLPVIDSTIERSTPSGSGFYRYGTDQTGSEDGYGDCYAPDPTNCPQTGQPWPTTDTGSGHLWPVLGGERGEYDVAAGNRVAASAFLTAMRNMTSGQGLEPEQVWEDLPVAPSAFGSDPTTASIGFEPGHPAGSASPLTWAQSQYARLALAISTGRDLETPGIVTRRYVTHGMPGSLPLTVASPQFNGSTATVSGTTTAGASVVAEALSSIGGKPSIASTTAGPSGDWTLTLPVGFGSTTITVTATLGRRTGYAQTVVTNVTLPGNSVLDVTDPTGDDNGPGTYQYPTAADFHAGAFDLQRFRVTEDGTNVYLQATLRNMDPTFGETFGAQLLDIYVHQPGATSTSTGAAASTFNYSVAPAWSQRLEAQGFASPIWVGPNGSLGSAQWVPDQASRTATLILPESTFGKPTSGWAFAVALTGQDGFSSDQARSFASTPQPFQFGVCASGDTRPICSVSPSAVPKVIDTITPAGVSQATELDPTHQPVVLQGVVAP